MMHQITPSACNVAPTISFGSKGVLPVIHFTICFATFDKTPFNPTIPPCFGTPHYMKLFTNQKPKKNF